MDDATKLGMTQLIDHGEELVFLSGEDEVGMRYKTTRSRNQESIFIEKWHDSSSHPGMMVHSSPPYGSSDAIKLQFIALEHFCRNWQNSDQKGQSEVTELEWIRKIARGLSKLAHERETAIRHAMQPD